MNYHNITYPDMNNGDGLRVVLWLSGCSHHCHKCQNPQTWNVDSGILFDENAKEELFRELGRDYISGITFSGGDPLHENNVEVVLQLIKEINRSYPNKTIWLYTGYTLEKLIDKFNEYKYTTFSIEADKWLSRYEIVGNIDVLVDGKYINEQRDITLKWRGSKNQRVIDMQETLKQNEVILYCD